MVLLGRIELPASPLPRECSTTELQQRLKRAALCEGARDMSSDLQASLVFGIAF
jgi:hypothetical protein